MLFSHKVKPFRFWSQKVLPLVYDDSLSYYEVLVKLVNKLNEVIDYVTDSLYETIEESIKEYFVDVLYIENEECISFELEDSTNE